MAGYSPKCSICTHENREAIETSGQTALAGEVSWRQAALLHHVRMESLKRHMEVHVEEASAKEQALAEDAELDALILRARKELLEQFDLVPADIKPLILVAIQNLDGLRRTKPSMATLIKSLKTIQEMTGMKNEQRLMLQMARGARRPKPVKVPPAPPELGPAESVEDAEVVGE